MYPRCDRARRARCARRPSARSHGDHVTGQRRSQFLDGSLSRMTSLVSRPRLRVGQQSAQLIEELAAARACAVEAFDPRQSLEYRLCFVHEATVEAIRSQMGNAFEPSLKRAGTPWVPHELPPSLGGSRIVMTASGPAKPASGPNVKTRHRSRLAHAEWHQAGWSDGRDLEP